MNPDFSDYKTFPGLLHHGVINHKDNVKNITSSPQVAWAEGFVSGNEREREVEEVSWAGSECWLESMDLTL